MSCDFQRHAAEVRAWVRRARKMPVGVALPAELERRYMHRGLAANASDDERAEFARLATEFRTNLPNAPADGSVFAPCRWTDAHPQPCLCPFLWFAYRCAATPSTCERARGLEVLADAVSAH